MEKREKNEIMMKTEKKKKRDNKRRKKKIKERERKRKKKNYMNSFLVWFLFFKLILDCTNDFMCFSFMFVGIVFIEFFGDIAARKKEYKFITNWEGEKAQKEKKRKKSFNIVV